MKHTHILFILGGLVVINGIIYVVYTMQGNNNTMPTLAAQQEVTYLFDIGEYTQLVANYTDGKELGPNDIYPLAVAFYKLGDYETASHILSQAPHANERAKRLYKIIALMKKQDREGVLDYAGNLHDSDPKIRSLYLQLRAQALLELGRSEDALILGKDSVLLDPLAPYGLIVEAITAQSDKERSVAHEAYVRAEKLGYIGDSDYLYARGVNHYHMKYFTEMHEIFSELDSSYPYYYDSLVYRGRAAYNQELYQDANDYFRQASQYTETGREYALWLGRTFVQEKDRQSARKAFEEGDQISPNNIELMTDMLVPLYYLDDQEAYRYTLTQIDHLLLNNTRRYTLLLRKLQEIGEYQLAWEYAQRALPLADKQGDVWLKNEIMRTIIYNYVRAGIGTTGAVGRFTHLVENQGSTLPEQYVFTALHYLLVDDSVAARRSLQYLDETYTGKDMQTIRILHHILVGESKEALTLLTEMSQDDEQVDIDYLWLKRKVVGMFGSKAAVIGPASEKSLLEVVPGLTRETIDDRFAQHFEQRLQYMLPYYPTETTSKE